jgi:2-desacetyl-2-hydroxyethyl bacteriochlorophyllide A dehydrogenase
MQTGRGVWFVAPRELELREETLRTPGPGEVRLEGITSLISAGTEMNVYRGEIGSAAELVLPTSRGEFPFPMNYGYQVVARVAELGEGVDLAVGDRVFAVHAHQDNFVMPATATNAAGVTRDIVTRVPDGVSSEQAAFSNLFAVALNGLLDAPVRVGDVVAVSGLGVVGSFAAYLARKTAGALVLIDPLAERRERAAWIGADAVVHPADAAEAIRELSGGRGADIVIEASGAPRALQTALEVTGDEGTILVLSYYGKREVPLLLSPEFHYKRLRIVSSMVAAVGSGLQPRWNRDRRTAVAFDELRAVDVDTLVSHRLPFAQSAEAYRLVDESPAEVLGVLLQY